MSDGKRNFREETSKLKYIGKRRKKCKNEFVCTPEQGVELCVSFVRIIGVASAGLGVVEVAWGGDVGQLRQVGALGLKVSLDLLHGLDHGFALLLGAQQLVPELGVGLDVVLLDPGEVVGPEEPDAVHGALDCRPLHVVCGHADDARPGWETLHLAPHSVRDFELVLSGGNK